MCRHLPPPLASLAAASVVVLALTGPTAVAAAPGAFSAPAAQADPTDTTAPSGLSTSTPGPTDTEPGGGDQIVVEEDTTLEAQRQADEDLRSVWVVVAGLAAVAVGLLVLLVVYVWATKPERVDARRRARLQKAQAKAGLPSTDDDESAVETVAAVPSGRSGPVEERSTTALRLPGLVEDGDGTEGTDGTEGGEGGDGIVGTEGGASASPMPSSGPRSPAASRGADAPTQAGPSRPAPPRPTPPAGVPATGKSRAPAAAASESDAAAGADLSTGTDAEAGREPPAAVLSREDDRDGVEGVKIIGDPEPSPARARPASEPRRPRRVKAPPKRLGTPDAERVLVRPGQAPVRVPPASEKAAKAPLSRSSAPEASSDDTDDATPGDPPAPPPPDPPSSEPAGDR